MATLPIDVALTGSGFALVFNRSASRRSRASARPTGVSHSAQLPVFRHDAGRVRTPAGVIAGRLGTGSVFLFASLSSVDTFILVDTVAIAAWLARQVSAQETE